MIHIDAAALRGALGYRAAVEVLREALAAGPPAVEAPPRGTAHAPGGHVLIMPAADASHFGIKVAGVAPGNPSRGLPRITGTYLLHDATTLQPILSIDGPALTLLRTAALSALAVDVLAAPEAGTLLLFGTGPQAAAHVEAMRAVRTFGRIAVAGRTADATRAFADAHGLDPRAPGDLESADVVVCCTSAATPLFDGRDLSPTATVVAMGSHTLDARELDEHTLRGVHVVVEDRDAATREAADVRDALASGALTDVTPLHAAVAGDPPTGRRVFRSVGMAWEDLAIATALAAGQRVES